MSTSRSPEGPEAAAPSLAPLELPGPDPGLCSPVTRSSGLTRRLLRLRAHGSLPRRRKQMVPTDKKDAAYWDKRQKNNQAAKRSREKRRLSDLMLEGRLLQLQYLKSLRAARGYSACQASESTFIPRTPYALSVHYTGMGGNTRSNRVSGLGDWHRAAAAARPSETMIPRLIPHPQVLNTFGAQHGIPALSDPRFLSPGAGLEVGSSAEAQMKGQRQITTSENIRSPPSIRIIPDFFPQAPILSYQPHSWPPPHGEHSAQCKNFLLPLKSPYMSPLAVHTVLPHLWAQGEQAGVPMWGQTLREGSGGVSAALNQLGVQLSPTGC